MIYRTIIDILTGNKYILFYLIVATVFFTVDAGSILLLIPLITYLTQNNSEMIELGNFAFLGLLSFDINNYLVFIVLMQLSLLFGSLITSRFLALSALRYGFELGNSYLTELLKLSASRVKQQTLDDLIDLTQRESERIGHSVILPLLICVSRSIFLAIISVIALLVFESYALIGLVSIGIIFYILGILLSPILNQLSANLNIYSARRVAASEDIFNGFPILKQRKIRLKFLQSSKMAGDCYANTYSKIELLINSPRYLIEFLIVICLCIFTFQTIGLTGQQFTTELGALGLFVIKFVPSANNVYQNFAKFKANLGALEKLKTKLRELVIDDKFFEKDKDICFKTIKKRKIDQKSIKSLVLEGISIQSNSLSSLYRSPINLKFDGGLVYTIIGENGSGKSTLLNIISGLEDYSKGKIIAKCDDDLVELNTTDLRSICWKMDQEVVIFKGSLSDNCTLFGFLDKDEHDSRSKEILQFMFETFPDNVLQSDDISKIGLSGGQKQRIGIIRALLADSFVLLIDEPTNSLDEQTIKLFYKCIIRLKKDRLIICVTHNEELRNISDCIVRLSDGSISLTKNVHSTN